MSSQQDPTNEIYRQGHQSSSTFMQAFEWQHTQILQLKEQLKMVKTELDARQKKIDDLSPNLKKPK